MRNAGTAIVANTPSARQERAEGSKCPETKQTHHAAGGSLGGEGNGSRPCERAGELGEDRQVGVEPDPIKPTDAERQ